MNKTYTKIAISLLACSPFVTFAQQNKTLKDIAGLAIDYLNIALTLLIGFAVVVFVWNVVKYFFFAEQDHAQAGMYVFYSILGFFIILSFWGIVAVVRQSLNLDDHKPDTLMFGGSTGSGNPAIFNAPANNGSQVQSTAPVAGIKPSTSPTTGSGPSVSPATGSGPSVSPATGSGPSVSPVTGNGSGPSVSPVTGNTPAQ